MMKDLGVPFEIFPSDAEETHSEHLTAAEACQINAYRKARAVAKKFPDALVLGLDTLVAMGHKLYGKPRDLNDAARMLRELQGKTHIVVSGVCLLHLRRHRQRIFADATLVAFRPLSDEQIRRYHKKIAPLDKAGGYAIQDHGGDIVESIQGSFKNVVGFPSERIRETLADFAL